MTINSKMKVVFFLLFLMCSMATNESQTETAQGVVDVERILPSVDDFFVFKGDNIKAKCTATNQDGIKNITWKFYDRSLNIIKDLKNNTVAKIINVWNENETAVRSVVETSKHFQSETFFLRCKVEYKNDVIVKELLQYNYIPEKSLPEVNIDDSIISNKKVIPNKLVVGLYNSSMMLRCTLAFDSSDKLENERVSIELTANSERIGSKRTVLYQDGKNVLVEYNRSGLQVDDGGMYMCQSTLVIGKRIFTTSKYVNVTFPLQLTGRGQSKRTAFPGQDIEIVCEIQAYPAPKWLFLYKDKDAKNITNITVVENRLEIDFVTKEHTGLYTCIGEDHKGNTMTQTVSLIVIDSHGGTDKAYKLSHYFSVSFALIVFIWLVLH